MRRSLHDRWWRLATTPPQSFADAFLSGILRSGAAVYGFGVNLRNRAYDQGWLRTARLACPVISVGNLTVGGTGKTTCVEYLAEKLERMGRRVCVLSRGYGGRRGRPYTLVYQDRQLLVNGQPAQAWDGLADEPQLLAQHLTGIPVFVGAQRERTGTQAIEELAANVVLLDDGLQYRRLDRDCEVVLVNARMPLSGWPLLPRGPMREPLSSLRRADVIMVTKADQSLDRVAALQERLRAFNSEAIMATAIHEPTQLWDAVTRQSLALERLANSRVSLLSSIGDPEGFEETVRRLGATVLSHTSYPDHHGYRSAEWREVLGEAVASRAEAVVTTEKDLIRLRSWLDAQPPRLPVWALRVQMRVLSGEELLDDRLARVCAR